MLQYVTPETLTNAPGGVGRLRILEALTVNELYQCHLPSSLIFIESADWDFRTI